MIAHHIHDALAQVRKLQDVILERRLFRGYSGKARILCGMVVITGAALISVYAGQDPNTILRGWGAVLITGLLLNYCSLLYWFLFDREVRRNPAKLKPALDAMPALAVGAVLTVALISAGSYRLLYGTWMCLYGLAQIAYKRSLPPGIYTVGLAYIFCGVCCLLLPGVTFANPWPMGCVFLVGEVAGGVILILKNHADVHSVGY